MGTVNFITLREDLRRTMSPDQSISLVTQLDELKCYEEVFSYFCYLEAVGRCLYVPLPRYTKNEDESRYNLRKAITEVNTPQCLDALKHFNKSLRLAPHPTLYLGPDGSEVMKEMDEQGFTIFSRRFRVLTAGYVNRSSCLLVIKRPLLCIDDLELASKCGVTGTEEKIQEMRARYRIRERRRFSFFGLSPSRSTSDEKDLPKISEPNPAVPAFSNALKVEYSISKGMHVVASRDIRPGELLVVEKSYCTRIYPGEDNGICPVCFERYIGPVPCPTCYMIMFCSVKCRIKGLKDHQRECQINNMIQPLGLFRDLPSSIALKVLIATPFLELKEKLPILKKESKELPPEKLGFDENGIFHSHDYRAAYHTASSRRKMASHQSLFSSLIAAYIMTKVLVDSKTYFVDSSDEPFDPSLEDVKMVGGALLHHLCTYPHGFYLTDVKMAIAQTPSKSEYGDGLFPSALFIRHSCIAPTVQYNLGDVAVVRAVFPIAAGQEVTVARGDFMSSTLVVRKLQFGSLGIECNCEACEEDWPLLRDFPDEYIYKCLKCKEPLEDTDDGIVCPVCVINYKKGDGSREQKDLRKKFSKMVKRLKAAEKKFFEVQGKIHERKKLHRADFKNVCYFAELLDTNVKPPCITFYRVRQAMQVFFATSNKF